MNLAAVTARSGHTSCLMTLRPAVSPPGAVGWRGFDAAAWRRAVGTGTDPSKAPPKGLAVNAVRPFWHPIPDDPRPDPSLRRSIRGNPSCRDFGHAVAAGSFVTDISPGLGSRHAVAVLGDRKFVERQRGSGAFGI